MDERILLDVFYKSSPPFLSPEGWWCIFMLELSLENGLVFTVIMLQCLQSTYINTCNFVMLKKQTSPFSGCSQHTVLCAVALAKINISFHKWGKVSVKPSCSAYLDWAPVTHSFSRWLQLQNLLLEPVHQPFNKETCPPFFFFWHHECSFSFEQRQCCCVRLMCQLCHCRVC